MPTVRSFLMEHDPELAVRETRYAAASLALSVKCNGIETPTGLGDTDLRSGQRDRPNYTSPMDTALISAFAALGGSVFGGLTSGLTTLFSLRSQARAGQRMHGVAQREDLYRDFIVAASRTFGSAATNNEPELQDVVVLYGMVSRMRVVSSEKVIVAAEKTIDVLMETFFAPNKTVNEIRLLMRSGEAIDPLKEFSETARAELRAF